MAQWYENIGNGLSIDWNPEHSPIWGAGPRDPYQAQYKAFNPADYQGIDTAGLGHAMRQQLGQNTARTTSRMQGALQRGGGGGADLISGMAGLQAQQGMDENMLTARLAQEDYDRKYQQWRDMMGLETKKAEEDRPRYERENKNRNAPWDFLGNIAGTGIGAFTGGLGGAAASAVGSKMFGK